MKQYLELMQHILDNGYEKSDRTGTGTKSVFGYQMRFDLQEGFPLVTTKKVHLKSVIHEMLWFLKGDTNIKYLNDNGVTIWDEWQQFGGELGPIYGYQWRSWPARDGGGGGYDQITDVIEQIKTNPDSRRLVVSAWNVADLPDMALQPCHVLFQFYVRDMGIDERMQYAWLQDSTTTITCGNPSRTMSLFSRHQGVNLNQHLDSLGVPRKQLSCQLYQRSADVFLGVPFNIASYALLTMMVAQVCGLAAGEFIHTLGDAHLYLNHLDQALEQLDREPKQLPIMKLNPEVKDIFQFKYEDFTLEDYDPHPAIKAEVAV